ncbi:SUR7 family protein [Lachnellula willkommii]|uniref:SUR7 family protein n=1 Tax=Lachnellula willkommii TaxID=215461 RepID=A0A559MNK6_9HELO|nr:SUR7 family protein [Lachnellula willkommii]
MRATALLPMACAIVGFVLSMLCLFAGHKPGFMEEYHIITLNTSTLGHNLIDKAVTTTTSSTATPTATSIGSLLSGIKHNITDTIEGDLNGILNDVADKLSQKLGIKQWYSLHLMDSCEGTYAPNATEKGADLNITTCSNETAMFHFNIEKHLNQQLEAGGLHINLTDLDFPDDIQKGLNDLTTALNATFVLYCIGIAAAGLAILTALIAFFLSGSRLISFGNLGLTSLSFAALLIASIIVTVVMNKASHLINKYGNAIGLYAYKGGKYLTITWVAVAVMAAASLCWVVEFCVGRRNKGREFSEKSTRGWGGWNRRRSDEAALRRSGV